MSPTAGAAAILLAAGRGVRMRSRRPKLLHPLLGEPLIRCPLRICRALEVSRLVAVVPPESPQLVAELEAGAPGPGVLRIVEQPEAGGAGEAVGRAVPLLEDWEGPVLVLAADAPLLTAELLLDLLRVHAADRSAVTRPAASGAEPPVWVFQAAALRRACRDAGEPGGEVETLIGALLRAGEPVRELPGADPESLLSVDDRLDLARAGRLLRRRILEEHMRAGVTVEDPETTWVDQGVRIGMDTLLRPMTFLHGDTVVGEGCELGPFVRVTNCVLEDGVQVQSAVLAESRVGAGTRVGPFAQLRPGCRVGRKVRIGNFVELKNAEVGDGAAMGHLAYLGDVFVGEGTNIGAGTITCNYDGRRKHATRIGREAFVGSHSTLVAPVEVGDGSFVAAGTVVTADVPPDALAIGRSRQETREGWARRRREQGS